jgi:hypothetical protein
MMMCANRRRLSKDSVRVWRTRYFVEMPSFFKF